MRWNVVCDCGSSKAVYGQDLTKGRTQSCGCLQRRQSSKYHRGRGKGSLAASGEKTCARCGVVKPTGQFHKCRTNKDGLYTYCKRCVRGVNLKTKYGVTLDFYEELVSKQEGRCGACGDRLNVSTTLRGAPPVDHCHKTGKVRAVLCHHCNTALGLLREDPDRVRKLMRYITEHNETNVETEGRLV